MRARIRIADYDLEFVGSAALWNECLRPILGGPVADETTTQNVTSPSVPAPAPARTTSETPNDADTRSDDRPRTPTAALAALAATGGRRAEKDAVLLAVHLASDDDGTAAFDAVARVMHAREAFRAVRVKPHLLKHMSRSRMLDAGDERETARLTEKGRRYVASLLE